MNTGIRFPGGVRLAPLAAALVAALASALPAADASAQDVAREARRHDTRAPSRMLERIRRDPDAYEFQRAWRGKAQRVREARAALEQRQGPRLSVAQIQGAAAAVTGTLKVPVILALYSDATAPYTQPQYQSRLFGTPATGYSAKTLYQEMSRGAFSLDGGVTPWMKLPQTKAYYEPSNATDPEVGRVKEFLRDALQVTDPALDFGQFDNDGPDGVPNSGDDDGYVDAAAFLYAADEISCDGSGIWPHRWTYSANWGAPFTTNDAKAGGGFIRVDDYLIQGGVGCDGASLMPIGTFAHEMGHALALPDLYDTMGSSEGIGEWDLMGSGSYNSEDSPAHLSAWSKDFLGWVNVETVTATRTGYTLPPVYQSGTVLRYDIPGVNEYFLLEHRNRTGADAFLHQPGLLLYHVDDDIVETYLWDNEVNAHEMHGVDVEEADGLNHLLNGVNRGDAGDVFPGSTGRTSFGATGTPNSQSNGNLASNFSLSSIALSGAGALSFNLTVGAAAPFSIVVPPPVAIGTPQYTSATFVLNVQTSDAALHAFSVVEGDTGTVDYPWLAVTPDSGYTAGIVNLVATPGSMAPGTYPGAVRVRVPGASNSPLVVPVTLTVSPAVGTVLQVPATVSLTAAAGATAQTTMTVTTNDGSLRSATIREGGSTARDIAWLAVAPLSGPTPHTATLTASAAGLTPGTYTDTLSVSAPSTANVPKVVVSLTVTGTPAAGAIALGDSVVGTMVKPNEQDTILINLNANDVFDLGVWNESTDESFIPTLVMVNQAGALVATPQVFHPDADIAPGFKVTVGGTYRIIVEDYNTPSSAYPSPRQYRLRTRASAPIVGAGGLLTPRMVKQGAAAAGVDSVRLRNRGLGTAQWSVGLEGSWLSAAPTSGSLAAGTPAPPASVDAAREGRRLAAGARAPRGGAVVDPKTGERRLAAAAGALRAAAAAQDDPAAAIGPSTWVKLSVSPAALPAGSHQGSVTFSFQPADVWNPQYALLAEMRVYDARSTLLDSTSTVDPGRVVVAPDGKLVAAYGSSLMKVDTTTGAKTLWAGNVAVYAGGMEYGPDGLLYVADWDGKKVVRVSTGGLVSTLFTTTQPVLDVTLAPDGTLYAVVGNALVKRTPTGTLSTVLTANRVYFAYGIEYLNGYVYYTAGGSLRRVSHATGADAQLGGLPQTANGGLLNLTVGPNGRLYGMENAFGGALLSLDTAGVLVERLWPAGVGFGLAARGGTLYGASDYPRYSLWKLPLGSSTPPVGTLMGDPSGDGLITSMDALGVLSSVVGKPVPAGWTMGAGDANCDGVVSSVDALIILSSVVQKDVSAFCVGTRK